jgi:hypothetical protein
MHESCTCVSALCFPSHLVLSWWQGTRTACFFVTTAHCPSLQSVQPLTFSLLPLPYRSSPLIVNCVTSVDCCILQRSFLQRRGPTAIKTVRGDRSSDSEGYLHICSRDKHPTVHIIPTPPSTTYRKIGRETTQRQSFHKKIPDIPPAPFYLTILSLPSTFKQLLSQAVTASNLQLIDCNCA